MGVVQNDSTGVDSGVQLEQVAVRAGMGRGLGVWESGLNRPLINEI